MGLVVSVVPASAEAHLWRIDTMRRRSLTWRPGRYIVVRFVVPIVVALGDVRVLGTEVAKGRAVPFHVQPPSMGVRVAADRSPSLIVRAVEGWRPGCCVVNGFVNESRRNGRDRVQRGVMAETGDWP